MVQPKGENVHDGHRDRMRERILKNGFDHLLDHEMLEYLLYFVFPRCDTNPIAHRLIDRFGSFDKVLEASFSELRQVKGVGEQAAMFICGLSNIVSRYLRARNVSSAKQTPKTFADLFALVQPLFVGKQNECLYLMCLSNRGQVIGTYLIREGSVNQVSIDMYRMMQYIMDSHASTVILFHNHPDGSAEPSEKDKMFTDTVQSTLKVIGIPLIDHVIVSGSSYYSMNARRMGTFSMMPPMTDRMNASFAALLPFQEFSEENSDKLINLTNYPIFDAHVHPFLDSDENICMYPLPVEPHEIGADLERIGITRFAGSVVTKNFVDFESIHTLNRHALKLREMYGERYIPGIHIHPDYVKESCEELKFMHEQGVNLIGELVPYMMGWTEYTCPGALEIFTYAQELGMTVSIHPTNDDDMLRLYQSFPRINFIAAHPGEKAEFLKHLERMELCQNAFLDVCGTGLFRYGMLSYGVSRLGSERFLFGTDYPVCSPGLQVQGVLYERMTDTDYENILYKNAHRLITFGI